MVDAYNPEAAKASYIDAVKALKDVDFPLVNLLNSKKDARMDEVLDCFLLDGPLAGLPEAAYLQPCIEQLSIPIYHEGDKIAVRDTSLFNEFLCPCCEGKEACCGSLPTDDGDSLRSSIFPDLGG
ncbi:hypothetical protein Tco_1290395 [Tanacetum coccineum]